SALAPVIPLAETMRARELESTSRASFRQPRAHRFASSSPLRAKELLTGSYSSGNSSTSANKMHASTNSAPCERLHGAYSALLMPSLKRRAPAQYSATATPLAVQRCPPSSARTLIVPLLQPMAADSSARHVSLSAYAPLSSTHAPASTCRGCAAYTSLGGGSVKRMYGTRGFITGFSTHRIGVPGMRAWDRLGFVRSCLLAKTPRASRL